ncbi:hypothetical protein PORY_002440 [Pneumocystis oryctolagi]|uniref:Uncharacterized protein n=1 Tax=Pneumocystis oryctolagi TaxID=42067 RepID=A0ACB7C991_9ASCO|nr:hypothetical protein PORY_002440 [Pneumocystis oryctolagi]
MMENCGQSDSQILSEIERRDDVYQQILLEQQERQLELVRQKKGELLRLNKIQKLRSSGIEGSIQVFGAGYAGYGNGLTGVKPRMLYPREHRSIKTRMNRFKIPKETMLLQSQRPELLVPVRIEVDSDRYRLRDTFTWNLHEVSISPEQFAEVLCEDFSLPPQPYFATSIAKCITDQLSEYHHHVTSDSIHDAEMSDTFLTSELPYTTYKDDDMRIQVKLDIVIAQYNLVDTFEWDINNPCNDPEVFAERMCHELALIGEFKTAIAHSIREQAQMYTKSLFLVGYPFDGRPIEDEDIKTTILPTVSCILRPVETLNEYSPVLYELSESEVEKQNKENERDARRKRRQIRARRGVQFPEFNERPKTQRTPIIHSVLVPENFHIDQYGINKVPIPGLNDDDDLERLLNERQRTPPPSRDTRTKTTTQQHTFSPSMSPSLPSRYILKLKIPRLKEFLANVSDVKPHSPPTNSLTPPSLSLPSWLVVALDALRQRYPHDRFEGFVRQGNNTAETIVRIRCNDCPGKLYIPGPALTVENFEIHLKNRNHRIRFLKKIAILGVQGSGKTAFFTKLCCGSKQKSYTSIRPNEAVSCFFPGKKAILIDFPGHPKFYHLFRETKHIKSVIFMIDASVIIKNAYHVAQQFYVLLKDLRAKKIKSVLIAANKNDLFTSLPAPKITSILEEKLSDIILSRSKGIIEMDENDDDDDDWLINAEGKVQLSDIQGLDVMVSSGSVENDHISGWIESVSYDANIQQHDIVFSTSDFPLVNLNDEKGLGIRGKHESQQEMCSLDLFFMAAKQGDLDLIEKMCKLGEIMPNVQDDQGVTALHWASINDHINVGRYLILNGVDVNIQSGEFHATPLHWAAKNGNLYMVHMLLQHGAYLHLTDSQGFTALHLAIHRSNAMLVLYLLHQNIQVDCLDDQNRTPLMWAAYNGDELIVDILLRWCANVKLQDRQGMTALHWAIVGGNKMCIKRLIEAGSNVFVKEYNGKTPEEIANEMNRYELWKRVLREAGRDIYGKVKRRSLTSKSSNIILFFGPFFVIGLLIWILTTVYIFFSIPLALLLSISFHQFFVKIVSTEFDSFFVFYKTKYLAGIFFGTLVWTILRWMFVLLPATWKINFFSNILFSVVSLFSIICFFYTMFLNPGYIPKPQGIEEQKEIIENLVKERLFMSQNYCVFCYIRRPLRSKHCKLCSRCVARFDHHCPWVGNCIGLRNHKLFVVYIIMLQIGVVLFDQLLFDYYRSLKIPESAKVCPNSLELFCRPFLLDSFTIILALWINLQFVWIVLLFIVQIFQISFSVTTNEARNLHKYGFMDEIGHDFYNESAKNKLQSILLNNQCSHHHNSHKERHHIFWVLLRFLGIHHFLKIINTFRSRFISRLKIRNPYSNGVLSNCRDFWYLGVGKKDGIRIINKRKQVYSEGNGYIKGRLVNYYYLYDFPSHKDLNGDC